MVKRNFLVIAHITVLYLVVLYLLFINDSIPWISLGQRRWAAVVHHEPPAVATPELPVAPPKPKDKAVATDSNQDKHVGGAGDRSTASAPPSPEELVRFARAGTIMPSILDPANTSIDRMSCPPINESRYSYLHLQTGGAPPKEKQYFFALNLRQCVDLLPRLLGSVLEALRFLGPEHCALSIVEGNSDDGTLEVLRLLIPELDRLGVPFWLASSTLDPSKGKRIPRLAMLRALVVEPVTGPKGLPKEKLGDSEGGESERNATRYFSRPDIPTIPLTPSATVIFLNDVSACAEDILELVHQRTFQSATLVCGMDWNDRSVKLLPSSGIPSPGTPTIFYDVWVARSMSGSMFFDIPSFWGTWWWSANLFFDHPASRTRFDAGLPTQVFSCWNGGVALAAGTLARGDVTFRSERPGECHQGEPQLLCKDLWWKGLGRIAVVPAVNFGYSDALGRWVKGERGYVSDFVEGRRMAEVDGEAERIAWEERPPDMVNCVPRFRDQKMLPWNESLV